MKGKKIDKEFVSDFIKECIKNNKITPSEFISEARFQISEIDNKIIEVVKLKPLRSKLLDVISSFE